MFWTCLLTCTQQFIYDTLISKHDGFPIILSSQTYIQPWKISFQWFDSLSSFDLCTYKEIFVNRVLSFTLVGWLWKLYQIGSHEFIDLVLIISYDYLNLYEKFFKLLGRAWNFIIGRGDIKGGQFVNGKSCFHRITASVEKRGRIMT